MMDSEELQSDLLALRRLYGLLINNEQYGVDAGSSENLDKNARQLLLNLLNAAPNNAFEAHAKILGTQFTTSYTPWSMPQGQPSDGLKLKPFSFTNAPTSFPSVQQVDLMTGDRIFSDPKNRVTLSAQTSNGSTDEYGIRLKRCRVCQKPKVKQLTKEVSIQDRNVLTLNNISQQKNHKRSWEVQNDMKKVEDSACTSNSPLPFDYVKSLALINLTDEEDNISREASTKILQIESCISFLQSVVKPVNLIDIDYESQPSQTGQIGNFVMGRSDPNNSIKGRRTWNPTNELSLQSQPFDTKPMYTMLPSSQTMSQTADNIGPENQHSSHMPEDTYNHSHSGGVTSNLNMNRSLYREQMDQKEMAEKEAMKGSEIIQWSNPPARTTVHSRHDYEHQEAAFMKQKKHGKTYRDQMDHYQGTRRKLEIVEPIRMVSPSSQSISDSPVSSSNSSSSLESQSQTESRNQKSSTSGGDSEGSSREVYSGSSGSWDSEERESKMYSFSGQENENPDTSSSSKSSGSKTKTKSWLSKTVPPKGHKSGTKKEPDISSSSESSVSKSKSKLRKTVSIKGRKSGNKKNPDISSSSESSRPKSKSKSREMVPTKGHKSSNKKELSVISSSESSGSKSKLKNTVHTKGHKIANKKEPNMSSSSESSGTKSKSRKTVPTKDHKNDNEKEQKMSSSNESSGSKSMLTKTVSKKGHKSANKKEPNMSSSSESSGSKSTNIVPTKDHKNDNKKEPKVKQVGRLKKLEDKLAVIFHHHHHHYHHHNHHPDGKDHHHNPDDKDHHHNPDDKDHHKKPIWMKAGKALGHRKEKDEAYGEQAVNKIQSKAIVVQKAGDKKQKGNLKALVGGVGGLLKHTRHAKKSKKSKGALTKKPSRKSGKSGRGKVGKKMQWWKMLQHQRKIKRIEKLCGKIAK